MPKENNNQSANKKNASKRTKSVTKKLILSALVGGIVGGGIVGGGLVGYQNHLQNQSTKTTKVYKNQVKPDKNPGNAQTAYNRVSPAVVSVESYTKKSGSGSDIFDFGLNPGQGKQSQVESAEGSGIIYKKSGDSAYVTTNDHVISGASKVKVVTNNNKTIPAQIVGKDPISDLAVLKIPGQYASQMANFANSNKIAVGQQALAIGSPLGKKYASSLTEGIISAKKRNITFNSGSASVIQTDAAINPGNSGGPLINSAGQVIGINSMKLSNSASGSGSGSTSVEGMGFAIPSNEVVGIVNQLATKGKITRPALGIAITSVSSFEQSSRKSLLKLPSNINSGAVVASVEGNSPLKNTGISKYDTITALGNKKVSGVASLRTNLYKHKVGEKVPITYYHKGHKETDSIKLNLKANSKNTTTSQSQEPG